MNLTPYENSKNRRTITDRNGVLGKECVYCGKWQPLVGGFTKGPYDGYDHRCRDCKKVTRIERESAQTIVDDTPRQIGYAVMKYNGAAISFESDCSAVCITEMWRSEGSPEHKRPDDWLANKQAKELLEQYASESNTPSNGITFARRGQGEYSGAGTWLPRELALAYAHYLSPALYLACNRFVLNRGAQFSSGQMAPQALDLIQQLIAPLYERLGMLDLLPGIDMSTQQMAASLLGARRIEIEVPAPIINGDVYFGTLNSRIVIAALEEGEAYEWANVPDLITMLQQGWRCFILGETMRGAPKRFKQHAGKNRLGNTTPVRSAITTDKSRKLQDLFRERRHSSALPVPGTDDLFVIQESALSCLRLLPNHMSIEDARWYLRTGWVWDKEKR